jgi:hypothetical protein
LRLRKDGAWGEGGGCDTSATSRDGVCCSLLPPHCLAGCSCASHLRAGLFPAICQPFSPGPVSSSSSQQEPPSSFQSSPACRTPRNNGPLIPPPSVHLGPPGSPHQATAGLHLSISLPLYPHGAAPSLTLSKIRSSNSQLFRLAAQLTSLLPGRRKGVPPPSPLGPQLWSPPLFQSSPTNYPLCSWSYYFLNHSKLLTLKQKQQENSLFDFTKFMKEVHVFCLRLLSQLGTTPGCSKAPSSPWYCDHSLSPESLTASSQLRAPSWVQVSLWSIMLSRQHMGSVPYDP